MNIAGWSSLVARRAHNPKVVGSNPSPATKMHHIVGAFLLFKGQKMYYFFETTLVCGMIHNV